MGSGGGADLGQLFGPVVVGALVQSAIDADAMNGPIFQLPVIEAVIDP